jgi:glycosyltransferase involved in cell wall biosynthesis
VSDRIRVMTLIDRLGPRGGAERLAVQIATRLDAARFESHFCASRHDAGERADAGTRQAAAALEAAGVRFLGLDRSSKTDIYKWAGLGRHLRRERIDVLHAHKHGSNVWGPPIARAARVPVVVTHEHTWSWEGEPARRFLDRNVVARLTDAHIAVSRADQERMTSVEGIPPAKTVFVPNGALLAPESGEGGDLRGELGLAPGTPLIGSAGFLRPQKAFAVLVEAMAALGERAHAVIAGEGDERPALEARIRELGLGGTVHLLGRRLDVPAILRQLDVAVCCSDFEGSPLSVMEYMEAARPIVATAVGGVPDLIEDGVHGRLVAPRDPAGLAAAIAGLLDDPAAAGRLGEAARERRRAEFDLDVMIGRLEELYERLLFESSHARLGTR